MRKKAREWHRGDRILDSSGLHAVIEEVKTGTGPTGKPVVYLTLAWSDGFTTVHYSSVAEEIIRRGGKHIPVAREAVKAQIQAPRQELSKGGRKLPGISVKPRRAR